MSSGDSVVTCSDCKRDYDCFGRRVCPFCQSPFFYRAGSIPPPAVDNWLFGGTGDTVDYSSGFRRSNDSGKPRFDLIDLDMLKRWAAHMAANVESKGDGNFRSASTGEDLARCIQSAWRHFVAFVEDQRDEDHAVALLFNVSCAEMIRGKLREASDSDA